MATSPNYLAIRKNRFVRYTSSSEEVSRKSKAEMITNRSEGVSFEVRYAVLMFDECSSREQRELGIQICGNGTELETSTDSASYVNIN